jgi:Tfp pilus assembly protein PilO
MLKKFPPSQKKIIIVTLVAVVVFLIFWVFIYSPSSRSLLEIRPQVYALESQVRAVEKILSSAKTPEAGAKILKDRFQELNAKLSQKEEKSLGLLSEFGRRMNIEIVSIKPQPKTPLIDESGGKIEYSGKVFQVVPVVIEMRCFYKDLVKYLQMLQTSLPSLVAVEKLKINRTVPKSPRLNVALEINLYTLF